jgi:hypothetical protein
MIQIGHGPDRQVPATLLETMPSAPSRARCANTVGPCDVFVEKDARLGIAERFSAAFSIEKWPSHQVLAIMLDKVEGVG